MVFVQEKDNKAGAKKLPMSGFKQSDLCVYQLLYITHEKYQLFNDSFEGRGIFLDMPKTFDKVSFLN